MYFILTAINHHKKINEHTQYMHELIHRMIIADNFFFSFTFFFFGEKDWPKKKKVHNIFAFPMIKYFVWYLIEL